MNIAIQGEAPEESQLLPRASLEDLGGHPLLRRPFSDQGLHETHQAAGGEVKVAHPRALVYRALGFHAEQPARHLLEDPFHIRVLGGDAHEARGLHRGPVGGQHPEEEGKVLGHPFGQGKVAGVGP